MIRPLTHCERPDILRDPVVVQVPRDYICEHGMPQPWATCTECMLLPHDEQPVPEKPPPPPKPGPKAARATRSGGSRGSSPRPKRPLKPARARLPRKVDDQAPELTGSFDLSYEVPAENLSFHLTSPDDDWLALSAMPHELRANGWVYLQVDRDLVARARVKGVGFRERRWSQEPTATATELGAGPTLELHPSSWERTRINLGADGEREVNGYRYLITGPDDSIRVADDDDLRVSGN